MAASHARRITSALCGTVGVLLVFAALLLGYLTRSLFNERAFAAHVATSLDNPHVAGFVAEQIADAVIKTKPDLVGLRPVLVGVGRSLVSSPPFRAAVRRGARSMHHAVFSGTGTNIVLSVQDLGVVLESVAETHPGLARRIPRQVSAALGSLGELPGGERAARLARLANRMRAGALGLLLAGTVLCVMAIWLASEKRQAIVRTGVALACLGLVLAVAARFGGDALALLARNDAHSPALAGLGDAFLGDLAVWAAGLMAAGLALSAGAASLLERVPLRRLADSVLVWLSGPQPLMRLRLARGILGALVGAALLMWPLPSLTVAAWLFGLVVAFAGLREGFVAALHLLPARDVRNAPRARPGNRAVAVVGGITVALIAVATWWVLRTSAAPAAAEEFTACNGSPALCDRTLDQAIFPTAHNAMGGAEVPGWMFPSQGNGIPRQLADGVRGLLIDAHYGFPVGDKVKTDLEDEKAAIAKYEAALGREGLEAVLRIRDRLAGQKLGDRDVYMCHGFCELGALKLVPALSEIREFLVENPGEVLIVVIQDESVTPLDIERCFQESGLIDFVYRGPARAPWPTLREMVETDQRVLVLGENNGGGVDWYHPAFQVLQETPYTFRAPSEFSNGPNRGGTSGSLYLLNHWIETTPMPKPSNAAVVNARDSLEARIRAFRRLRGHTPNLVAVDFYDVGDLISVVRDMNEAPE